MKDIKSTTDQILAPLRAALKESAEAAARLDVQAKLEAELEDINAKVVAAPDSATALSYVDPIAKLQAKLSIARMREPIERQAAGKAAQAVDVVLSDALQQFSQTFIEPLRTRIFTATGRFAFVSSLIPEGEISVQALPIAAFNEWETAKNSIWPRDQRAGALEKLIPLLPEAFERLELIEKAAAVLAPLDKR